VWREVLGLVQGMPHWLTWLRKAEGAHLEVWLLRAEPKLGRLLWLRENVRPTPKECPTLNHALSMSENSFMERWPEYPGDSVMRETMNG
jgi:hypothetical protein